jgi:uncharacterized protein YndB with AHSA1/START domain
MKELDPICKELVVGLDADAAFDLFTAQIGTWWPIAEKGVLGAGASVAFHDGELIETKGTETSLWGTVTEWSPGKKVAFTWHPGAPAERASAVSVTFESKGSGTRVVLEHSGWETFAEPAAARGSYDTGWSEVLKHFEKAVRP